MLTFTGIYFAFAVAGITKTTTLRVASPEDARLTYRRGLSLQAI
jgi:hypothetical protein